MARKPVRVILHYNGRRGALLSAGLSYQAIFAVFAAIWLSFAITGFVINANPGLRQALLDLLTVNVPGLVANGDLDGAIDPELLFSTGILGWTGAIAAVGLLFTALGWLDSGRNAVRAMFDLRGSSTNFLLLKLKDLGVATGFGLAVLASAALSVLSTAALGTAFDTLGIAYQSTGGIVVARSLGLLATFVLDALLLGLFYRVVSGIRIPIPQLAQGTLIGAAALGALKALGSTLLGGASANPLLASFAVIVGLLIWFNLVCQVILFAAAWISVSASDAGVDLMGARRHQRVGAARKVGAAL